MKLKTILLTATILASLFSSCSEENYVDPVIKGDDAILAVNLSVKEDLVSKANLPYDEPDDSKEKLMSNYVIAIFNGDHAANIEDDRIAFTASKVDKPQTSFSINNIIVKGGEKRKVLILANLPQGIYNDLVQNGNTSKYANLAAFKKLLKVTQEEAFKSDGLIKVLLKEDVSLAKGKVNTLGSASDPLKLIQLPARVDVKIAFNEEDAKLGASFDIKSFSVKGINTASDLILSNLTSVENSQTDTKSSVSWTAGSESEYTKTFSFYTYEKITEGSAVTIEIGGTLKEDNDDINGVEKKYSYTLNPKKGGECKTTGIVHGNVYDINGVMDLKTKTVTFKLTVKDWAGIDVDASIKDVHYLFVSEHKIVMANVPTYNTLEYASDLPVKIANMKSYYWEMKDKVLQESVVSTGAVYDITGQQIKYNGKSIKVIVGDNNKILIESDIPTNLAPLYISFSVETQTQNLVENITVIQYPSNYITGSGPHPLTSKWHFWSGSSSNANIDIQYIFMVNVVTAFNGYRIGNPTKDGYTLTDEESNKMISPKFVIASQNGASQFMMQYASFTGSVKSFTKDGKRDNSYNTTATTLYPSAEDFCHNYSEGIYKAGSWRLPTLAELEYVRKLEYEHESATGKVLAGDEYWSALTDYAYAFTTKVNNGIIGPYKPATAHTRCVRDVY